MCGILGYAGGFEQAALLTGLAAIAHRGPDDFGVFTDAAAGVGLGFVRLSIQDLSPLGHQPMLGADGAVVLVFNGEIYNFRELRTELEAKDHSFRGHSDTEVLLNLYLTEGEVMLGRLNGVFAFALWDARKQALLIVRDALGVKPLYYAALDGRFAFASELKALLRLAPQARELDVASLHRYLSFLWCPSKGTPLKAVRKFLPGEATWVRAGQIERRWTWYELRVFRGLTADLDDSAALEGTASHLRQAVQRQMMADVPAGAFLPGCLASSAVVAFTREQNQRNHCSTIESKAGQEEGGADDVVDARRAAKHVGVSLEETQ